MPKLPSEPPPTDPKAIAATIARASLRMTPAKALKLKAAYELASWSTDAIETLDDESMKKLLAEVQAAEKGT